MNSWPLRRAARDNPFRVAYEIFLLPVPSGADPEESGEALLARLGDLEEAPEAVTSDPGCAAIVAALRAADATVGPAPSRAGAAPGPEAVVVTDLRSGAGIEITVARTFARFRVPFQHRGEDAEAVFERLFRLLTAGSAATTWRAYDPQEAEAVPLSDEGRDATLEIYLTVMDQLRPGGAAPGARR